MTAPDPTNTIILQFIREELASVRTSMHDELTGLRADFSSLSDKLGGHITDTASRVAVLEHRVDEISADDQSEKAVRRANVTLALGTVMAIASVVVPIITK